jgi:preprotein translocase subunit SecG
MKTLLLVVQILVAISLVGLILLQNSKGGLSSAVASSEGYRTKRGAERIVFSATIVFAIIFLAVSVTNLLIK